MPLKLHLLKAYPTPCGVISKLKNVKFMSQPNLLRSLMNWFRQLMNVHVILISLVYAGLLFIIFSNLVAYDDYKSFAKQVLGASHVETCPQNCAFNLTARWRDPRAVIVVDNPSGTLVLLKLNTTRHNGVWVAADRTTQINVTFDGGLYVDVYPIYPFSDAAPRHAYLPGNGNLTIRVTPPAIGGVLQLFQTIISAVIGLLATLGIIKHMTKTPAVNAIGSTSFLVSNINFNRILLISLILFLNLIVTIAGLDFVTVVIIILTSINPILLLFLKSLVAVSNVERAAKVGFLHLYDLAVLIWGFLWLINPILTIFRLEYIMVISFFLQHILIIVIIGGFLVFIISLITEIISPQILFFSIVPFIFNQEVAARVEFCRRALDWPTKVKVYPESGKPVVGFVVECDVGKIAVSNKRRTRVFSWGDVHQIELL